MTLILSLVPKKYRGYDPGGEEFVGYFKENYPGIQIPNFKMGKIEEVIDDASNQNKPLLVYIHNHKKPENLRSFILNTIGNTEAIQLIVFNNKSKKI